jgi:Uma2 family endonuclease
MSSTTATPQSPAIEYPDSDGEPMAENTLQFKWIVTIKEGLDGVFRHDPNVFVAGDLLWYPVEGHPEIRLAPDTLVAFGRPKGNWGSYKQWEEGGLAPQVIFEVLSPGNRPPEMANKFAFYERYGVEEYFVYDPDTGDLAGWLRQGGRLEPVPEMDGFVSPRLGVRFEPGEGPDNLVIIGPDGRPLLTYAEVLEERDAAEQRAARERERAAQERERAERLAAKLRELGIDPDQA